MRYKRNKIITAIIVLLILVIGIITMFLLTGKKFSNNTVEAQFNSAKQYEATLENGYIQPIGYSVEYWTNKPARLMWQYNENYIQDIIQRTITQIQNEGNEIKEVREPKYFTLEPMDSQSTENMEYDFYDVGYNGEIIISQNGVYNYYLTSEPITILFFDKQNDTNIALELERIHAEMHIKIDKIDTIKPTITKALTAKMASTSSISAEVQFRDELSGFSQIEWYYKKSTDNDYTLYATDTDIPINASQAGNTNSVTKTKTIDNLSAGTYNIKAKIYDVAGNSIESSVATVTVKDIPTLVKDDNVTFSSTPSGWTNGTVSVKVTTNVSGYTLQVSSDNKSWQDGNTITRSTNGQVYARLAYGEFTGGAATYNVSNIDKTAPTVELSQNGGSYVMPTSGNAIIKTTIEAKDNGGSGLNKLEYAWSQSNTSEPSSWTKFISGDEITKTDITEPGTWYLWTNVTDGAGNRATNIKVSNGFMIGSNLEEENMITFDTNIDGWTNKDVTVTPKYGANLTQNRILTSTGEEGIDYQITGTQVIVKNSGIAVTATAQDIAGNTVKATMIIYNIDKEAPIVTLTTNGGNYIMPSDGNAKIETVITAEDAGGSDLKTLEYAWSQSNTTEPTEWTKFNNGEEVIKSDITVAGIWYLWVRVTDNAGNSNILKSKEFIITVDEENPEPETHLITYNYSENGGTSVTQETDTKKEGEKINLNVIAQKAGYEFIGWNTNKNATTGLEELEMAKEDVTLYAIYKKDITIQFVDYTDTKQTITTKTLTIFNEETAKTTAPEINEYTGWTAEYWTDKEEPNAEKILFGGEEITDIKENATYYARYSKTYTIKFDLNGGQGEGIEEIRNKAEVNSKNINIVKNAEVTIPEITAIKEGYDAISWNTKADGTGIDYSSGEKALFINDITLFIRWNKEQEEPDEPIPTLPDISVEKPEGWTNKNIPVKIKQTGTTKIVKVMVNGVEIQPTNNEYNYEIEENGTYIVEIVDEDNNTFRKEITVVSIDKTSPEIVKIENTSKDESQKEVIVDLKLQDEGAGVAKVEYSYDGTTWNDCLGEDKDFIVTSYSYQAGESTISMKWTKEADTKIYFRVTDNVGNVSEVKSTEIKLIQEDPDDNNDDPDNNNSGNNTNNNNNGNNTNNQGNNGNIDNTISKEELPHAGNVKTIVLISSIITLSVIAIVLRKKYKFLKGIIK